MAARLGRLPHRYLFECHGCCGALCVVRVGLENSDQGGGTHASVFRADSIRGRARAGRRRGCSPWNHLRRPSRSWRLFRGRDRDRAAPSGWELRSPLRLGIKHERWGAGVRHEQTLAATRKAAGEFHRAAEADVVRRAGLHSAAGLLVFTLCAGELSANAGNSSTVQPSLPHNCDRSADGRRPQRPEALQPPPSSWPCGKKLGDPVCRRCAHVNARRAGDGGAAVNTRTAAKARATDAATRWQHRRQLMAPSASREQAPDRQRRQRVFADSSGVFLFWGGVRKPVAGVAGGRPPLCVLAKLAGEGSGNAPASPREHQWPRQETGHCPRSARAAQQQHRRDQRTWSGGQERQARP